MGSADVNGQISRHHRSISGTPTLVYSMVAGHGGVPFHGDADFDTAAQCKQACAAAAVSQTQFESVLTTGQLTWFQALPADAQACIVADAAKWHADKYSW